MTRINKQNSKSNDPDNNDDKYYNIGNNSIGIYDNDDISYDRNDDNVSGMPNMMLPDYDSDIIDHERDDEDSNGPYGTCEYPLLEDDKCIEQEVIDEIEAAEAEEPTEFPLVHQLNFSWRSHRIQTLKETTYMPGLNMGG